MTTSTISLDADQLEAVQCPSVNILCLAGAGSGKTRTLIERIKDLVRSGESPASMVAITYTNAAAKELSDRLDGIKLGFCGTLHGFVLRLVKAHHDLIGFGQAITILDEDQAADVLDRTCERLKYKGTKKDLKAALANGVNYTPAGRPRTSAELVASSFYRTLQTESAMTFDSILEYGTVILAMAQQVPYRWLFVDELQDAADADAEIYRRLPITNKFFVGDGDQAIFGFRGGKVRHIMDLAQFCTVIKLQNNYRSDVAICEAAQNLIEHNTERIDKITNPVSHEPGTVMVHRHATAGEELAWLANCITTQKLESCAVLVRYNIQVDQITQYLAGLGIPVLKRETTAKPTDWRRCRNTLSLFSDPENNLAAYWFIRDNHGQDKAEGALLSAAVHGQSINSLSLNIPEVIALADVPNLLARCNITLASIDLVQKGIALLDADKTVADLIFALTEADFHQDETGTGITVSTMHSAKGREWDIVFLPGFEQQTIPGNKQTAGVEEERRLAFVAMTRARHGLFLSYVEKRAPMFGPQTPVAVIPSQFIVESRPVLRRAARIGT